MFSRIEVNGGGAHPLYQWLKSEQPGAGDTSDIGWNFEKFLVSGAGEVLARWPWTVTPEEIGDQLARYL